jgi:predicted house-cleaning NTP pyrophosphatase (Maf/HAM1 superfamily)
MCLQRLSKAESSSVKVERADADWIQAWVEENTWHAACGPLNLDEALGIFIAWVGSN